LPLKFQPPQTYNPGWLAAWFVRIFVACACGGDIKRQWMVKTGISSSFASYNWDILAISPTFLYAN